MSASKITTIVIVTIILTVVVVALANVGMSIFYPAPEYNKYCVNNRPIYNDEASCTANGGQWNSGITNCDSSTCKLSGYCNQDYMCSNQYNIAQDSYNQIRFYIFVSIGVILILAGIFIPVSFILSTGLLSGLILIGESIIYNFKDKIAVFITLIIVLILIGIGTWKALKKMK